MARQEIEYSTLGKYKVMGVLGRGSMGVVYRCFDPEIGRTVAIKTLRKIDSQRFGGVEGAVERFRNEARSAGNLRHPNIITVFEVSRDGDVPFIVMDCVEGQSLDLIIRRSHRLPPPQAIDYLSQAASAIDYAHSRGVIHRDIKPSNIMVDTNGTVFVLDFGVASITKSYADWDPPAEAPIVGTPGYMSPEQILNQKLDGRSDVFSLAVVAYECMTGVRPYSGNSYTELLQNVVHGTPKPLTAVASDLPLSLEAEFDRGMAREPDQRFKSAADMVVAFSRAIGIQYPGAISLTASAPAAADPEMPSSPSLVPASPDITGSGIWSPRPPRVDLEPSEPLRPGSVFKGSGVSFADPVRRDPNRLLKLLAAVAMLVVGGALIWQAIKSRRREESFVQTPGAPVRHLPEPAPFKELRIEPAPPTGNLYSFNDRQILGILQDRQADEKRIVDALREAHRRQIPELVDASVPALEHDSHVVRVETLKILAEIGDLKIAPKVMMLLDDYDPLVRSSAAKALGTLGDRGAVSYLYNRRAAEDSPDVRQAIDRAIEAITGLPPKKDASTTE